MNENVGMANALTETDAARNGRRRLRPFIIYGLPLLVVLVVVAAPALSTVSVLPRLGASPGFALIDQGGDTVTSEDLRNEIVVFGLASLACGAGCHATLDAMRDVAGRFAARSEGLDGPAVRLVTIVVDPVEDAAVLREFASRAGISGERWSVLSGSEATLRAVVGAGFQVSIDRSPDGSAVHEPAVFLSDHAGIMRAEYRNNEPRSQLIGDDVDRILAEANAGRVQGLLYNAAHSMSFSCGS